MRKTFVLVSALICFVLPMRAQDEPEEMKKPLLGYVSVQVGEMYSYGENAFTYSDNDKGADLFNPIFTINAGHGFGKLFEGRLSLSYGNNAGACNSLNTSGGGFFPYSYKSINVFADLVLSGLNQYFINGRRGVFSPRLYIGVGGAYTYDFTDSGHPWQRLTDKNYVLGFRLGFIGEYDFSPHLGVLIDLCAEGYPDNYNGLRPTKQDQDLVEGYAGFPIDLRGIASVGLIYRFK